VAKLKNKNKSLARENIIKILYQQDVTQYELNDICKNFIDKREYDKKYLSSTLDLIENNKAVIIDKIESNTNVKVSDTSPIDRSILFLSVSELLFKNDIPPKVVLDEAIKIAKKYSTEKSYKFINTILDKILKKIKQNDQK
jgi:N utilization substance protein B